MNIQLREFTEDDYPGLVELLNSVWPEHPRTVDELRQEDRTRPAEHVFRCWLAEREDRPLGFGTFGHIRDSYHPHKFGLNLGVDPDYCGRGIGRQLYDHLLMRLEPYKPISLESWAREDQTRRVRFWQDRGFEEAMREFESRLDVSACDLNPDEGLEQSLREKGIEVKTLDQLEPEPDYQQKIYELHTTLDADVPMTGVYTPPSFETFAQNHFESSRLIEESFFVAVKGGEYIGMSELWRSEAGPFLQTGLTGVLPEHRRQGVALAMKVAGVRFAQGHGYPEIRTWNAANNRGMLAINERLGYQKRPASIVYRKNLAKTKLQRPSI